MQFLYLLLRPFILEQDVASQLQGLHSVKVPCGMSMGVVVVVVVVDDVVSVVLLVVVVD